jgi:hypothetical protein
MCTGRQSAAQNSRPIELGIDASASFGLDSPSTTTIAIPVSDLRAGFYFSNMLSLEPSVSLTSISSEGDHLTTYTVGLGALIHLQHGRQVGTGLYVRPFAGLSGVSLSGTGSTNQAQLGVGLGYKLPLANRLATRFEVNYMHGFETDDVDSSNDIGLRLGLSFFTR